MNTTKRVTGIGGVFFKAKDAPALQAWYKKHLGINVQDWGGAIFNWSNDDGSAGEGITTWLINPQESDYFAPSASAFMINYRVENLESLVKTLKEEGCAILDKTEKSEYGTFAWLLDPEGNKVELWEPPEKS